MNDKKGKFFLKGGSLQIKIVRVKDKMEIFEFCLFEIKPNLIHVFFKSWEDMKNYF